MTFLYGASALLGGYVAYLAFTLALPFMGWVAIIALIVFTLLIELFKDNKVQAWLQNGYWGNRAYKTPEVELKQLELATAS